jgi:hypothetical protein
MPWHIPLALNVLITYVANPIAIKKSVGLPGRTPRLVLMFFGNATLAGIFLALFPEGLAWDTQMLMAAGVGVANSFACYAHWRAADISLSRTSVLAQGDDIIALALGYLILNETQFVDWAVGLGVFLCMGSAIVMSLSKRFKSEETGKTPRAFMGWVALYVTLWGVAVFSLRYFGMNGMSVPAFLFAWYGGSFIGSLVVAALMGKKEREGAITRTGLLWVLALCATSLTGLGVSYWAKCLAPITVVQPILQVAETILPTLLGLFLFKEVKEFGWKGKLLFSAGFAGSLVLAFAYH